MRKCIFSYESSFYYRSSGIGKWVDSSDYNYSEKSKYLKNLYLISFSKKWDFRITEF